MTTYPNYDSAYYGAMREDIAAKKVFFRGKDWSSELLLFNFDLKVGDTIKGWYTLDSLPSSTYFLVKRITMGRYNSNSKGDRRIFELEAFGLPTWATFQSYSGLLYEGIGFGKGLFKSPINSSKYKRQFRQSCFYDGVVETQNCESLTGVEDINNSLIGFTLYPNPTNATLTIKGDMRISKLVVYQSNGLKVLESTVTENLDVSSLPQGLYLLEIIDDRGNRQVRKFEKR